MHVDLLGRGNSSSPRDGASYKEMCSLPIDRPISDLTTIGDFRFPFISLLEMPMNTHTLTHIL